VSEGRRRSDHRMLELETEIGCGEIHRARLS
jgi:hypothetical protein